MAALMPASIRIVLCCAALCAAQAGAWAGNAPSKRAIGARSASIADARYASRADAMQFADEVAARRGLDRAWVRRAIGRARHLPQVERWVLPPPGGTAKNWRLYRSRFIEPVRIGAGVAFWQSNAAALARAEHEFGVPAQIIVGIIGVETFYGRVMGDFRAIDALATLSFDFPAQHPRAAERQTFFRAELEQLLALAQRSDSDPLSFEGSYAGAMGMAQFMPSSWVRYAIDFDGDGRIDLFDSAADAIGSVANYLAAFDWRPGMPTHYGVAFDQSRLDLDALLAPDILPTFSVAGFSAKGALVDAPGMAHKGPLALVELQNGDDPPSFVAGTENFYAITRYNWSSYYAMAVIELGRAVASALAR